MSKSPVYIGAGSAELSYTSALDLIDTSATASDHLAAFQSIFHGSSGTAPSGGTVSDGDLWFDTSVGVDAMKVYSSTASAWELISPTASEQTNINALAAPAVITDMDLLGASGVIDDIALLAVPEVITDMGLLGLAPVITDMDLIGATGVIGDIERVSDNVGNLTLVGDDLSGTFSSIEDCGAITAAVSGSSGTSNVTLVAGQISPTNNVALVGQSIDDVNRYANEYKIADSEPSGASAGDLWYDGINDVLKFYNGSNFITIAEGDLTAVVAGTGLTGTSLSGPIPTLTIDSTVATLTGSQALTNKTLTSPVINTGVSGSAVLDSNTMTGNSTTKLASSASIKAYVDTTVAATNEVVEDTTPQLGGDLDLNSNDITGTGGIPAGNLTGNLPALGLNGKLTAGSTEIEGSNFDINGGDISAATISGGLTWSAAQNLNSQNLTNVDIDSGTIDGVTITSPVINTGVSGSAIKDEDNMSSNSDTHIATQQSIKKYVDDQVGIQDLDVAADSGTAAVDLDTQSFTLTGGTGIGTTATGQAVTFAIDSTVATLSGAQTFTGTKTFTTPLLGTPTSGILTNCTALPAAQVAQGTMVSGMVLVAPVLGTPASGNISACTSTSMVMVTPNLGTPSALVGTNISGTAANLTAGNVTDNADLTGPITSSGNATAIAADAINGDKIHAGTISGSVTLVTPDLGTPSSMMLDFGTI